MMHHTTESTTQSGMPKGVVRLFALTALFASTIMPSWADLPQVKGYATPAEQAKSAELRQKTIASSANTLKGQPSGIDLPPPFGGASFVGGFQMRMRDGRKVTQLNFSSTQASRDVVDYYERSLRASGYKVAQSYSRYDKGGEPNHIMGKKDPDTTVTVSLSRTLKARGCRICIVLSQPK
jgi:hypothetical protein